MAEGEEAKYKAKHSLDIKGAKKTIIMPCSIRKRAKVPVE